MESTTSHSTTPPPLIDVPRIIERVKLVLTQPKTCWPLIQQEQIDSRALTVSFLIPMVVLGAIITFVSYAIIGVYVPVVGLVRLSFFGMIFSQVIEIAVRIGAVYGLAMLIAKVAPNFGASTDFEKTFKLVVHSSIPGLVATLAGILPWVSVLIAIGLGIYSLYILYQAIPHFVTFPEQDRLKFTLITIACGIAVNVVAAGVMYIVTPVPHYATQGKQIDLETIHEELQKIQNRLGEQKK